MNEQLRDTARIDRNAVPGEPGVESWTVTLGSVSARMSVGLGDAWRAPDVAMRTDPDPPFRMLVIADLGPDPRPLPERTPVRVQDEPSHPGLRFLAGKHDELFVLNASKAELDADALRRLFCEGGPDWVPLVHLMIGDFEIDRSDLGLLRKIAAVARDSHAPFVAGVQPGFFGIDDWSKFPHLKDPKSILEGPQYKEWREFRETEEAAYVGLALPRFRRKDGPWCNAAFAYASCVAAAFAKSGWRANLAGADGGGLVPDTEVEVAFQKQRERELTEEGFLPLVPVRQADACFAGTASCRKPKFFGASREAQQQYRSHAANGHLTARFVAARFAHLLKFLEREVRPGRNLEAWLSDFVGSTKRLTPEAVAGIPFRSASLTFDRNDPRRAVLKLEPNFQEGLLVEEITFGPGPIDADPFGIPEARRKLFAAGGHEFEMRFRVLVVADLTRKKGAIPIEERRDGSVDGRWFDSFLESYNLKRGGVPLRRLSNFEAESIARLLPDLETLRKEREEWLAVRSARAGGLVTRDGDPDRAIAKIDARIREAVDEVRSDPVFAALESTWRGLRRLVEHPVEFRVVSATLEELLQDFEDAPEISRSGLHRIVHDSEPLLLVAESEDARLRQSLEALAEKCAFVPVHTLAAGERFLEGYARWRSDGRLDGWELGPQFLVRGFLHVAAEAARAGGDLEAALRDYASPIDAPEVLRHRPFRRVQAEARDGAVRVRVWFHGADEPIAAAMRMS